MSISDDFFKDEKVKFYNTEEAIVFLINNYSELLSKFRVMQAQIEETKMKKEMAHENLQKLRVKMERIKKDKIQLTDQEKEDLEERRKYYTRIREENDIIFYNGIPMELDKATVLLQKHQTIFSFIEKIDRMTNINIGKIVRFTTKTSLAPIKHCLGIALKQTKNKSITTFLKMGRDIIINFPESFEKQFTEGLEVDLDKHRPVS